MRVSFVLAVLSATVLANAGDQVRDWVPPEGFVPNAETAIRIAVAVWEPIYGAAAIAGQKPYMARLQKGIWVVEGTVHTEMGGAAVAAIMKSNGKVLRVSHGR
jgi:hypothetical protein